MGKSDSLQMFACESKRHDWTWVGHFFQGGTNYSDRFGGVIEGSFPKVYLLLVVINKLGGQMLSKKQAWMMWQAIFEHVADTW